MRGRERTQGAEHHGKGMKGAEETGAPRERGSGWCKRCGQVWREAWAKVTFCHLLSLKATMLGECVHYEMHMTNTLVYKKNPPSRGMIIGPHSI